MTRDDVINLFKTLRAAGLKPPLQNGSAEQANQMVNAFLGQYKNVTAEELQQLMIKLTRLPYWPRFYDVDEVLRDCRRQKEIEDKKPQQKLQADNQVESILGRPLRAGESCTKALAEHYAKTHYKDASLEWVHANRLNISAQAEFDYECDGCYGMPTNKCKFGGHRPFLRVDKYTGDVVMLVDSAKCGKAIASEGGGSSQGTGCQHRGGGFSSFGDIASNM